jgi:colanic acid biosynthesis glycosyl transferase WcaI
MRKPGKVVIASQHYPPDSSTTADIISKIAWHLAAESPVLVLSGTPGSATNDAIASNQPAVVEIKNRIPAKSALIKRAAAEASFAMRTFMALLKRLQRGDVAVTVTAPFMLPYAVVAAARLKRARSALVMHDLYPDVLVMADLLKPASIPARAIRAANVLMFRALDAVVIIGRDTERLLLRYSGMTPGKIRFIPNWATLHPAVRPIRPDNPYRRPFPNPTRKRLSPLANMTLAGLSRPARNSCGKPGETLLRGPRPRKPVHGQSHSAAADDHEQDIDSGGLRLRRCDRQRR